MQLTIAISIGAPPGTVWDVIEPIEQHVDWMADAEAITFTGPTTRGMGTTFDCATRVGPLRVVDRMRIIEWVPDRTMGIEHRGWVRGAGRFSLTSVGPSSTEFTWSEQLVFPWWMGGAFGAAAARPVLRAIWRRNLRRLKAIVESRTQRTEEEGRHA
jgi:Polyketide cyclase / dehydrase and lipid transport